MNKIRSKYGILRGALQEFEEAEMEETFEIDQLQTWIFELKRFNFDCPCTILGFHKDTCPFDWGCYDCVDIDTDYCDSCDYCGEICGRSKFWSEIQWTSKKATLRLIVGLLLKEILEEILAIKVMEVI